MRYRVTALRMINACARGLWLGIGYQPLDTILSMYGAREGDVEK